MSIGYACLTTGIPDMNYKTCISRNATKEKLTELISHNLSVLDRMLDYNIQNNIRLFRISSDIIPFGSSPVNTLDWESIFSSELSALGEKALLNHIRLSMHPGQYTVLNSPDEGVVERAVTDLDYHARFLDSLGLPGNHKMILHIGGIYGNKEKAMERFRRNYRTLSSRIKNRLIIENDHKMYTIEEVLSIGTAEQIPVVFDNLHNEINKSSLSLSEAEWIRKCQNTWTKEDGCMKIHYSEQAPEKNTGSHSDTVCTETFLNFYHKISHLGVDIILEVKDKNLSAVKCILASNAKGKIKNLEQEWSYYKYLILERSPNIYKEIRSLLKDKSSYPAVQFFSLIEQGLLAEPTKGTVVNAAQHVWGYFKGNTTDREKNSFDKLLTGYSEDKYSIKRAKTFLNKLAHKYGEDYLIHSYYFYL